MKYFWQCLRLSHMSSQIPLIMIIANCVYQLPPLPWVFHIHHLAELFIAISGLLFVKYSSRRYKVHKLEIALLVIFLPQGADLENEMDLSTVLSSSSHLSCLHTFSSYCVRTWTLQNSNYRYKY